MQILAKMVNDPINSSGIFAAALGLFIWHGLYWHCGIEIPQLVLTLTVESDLADSGLSTTADSGPARRSGVSRATAAGTEADAWETNLDIHGQGRQAFARLFRATNKIAHLADDLSM
jgi:hypothetical protein